MWKNPEDKKEYHRQYSLSAYHRSREAIIRKLGGKCVICKSTNQLQICRKSRTANIKVSNLWSMAKDKLPAALKKCELLCFAHRVEKIDGKGEISHGTWYSTFKKKCRCNECLEYKEDYNLDRRIKRAEIKKAKMNNDYIGSDLQG